MTQVLMGSTEVSRLEVGGCGGASLWCEGRQEDI